MSWLPLVLILAACNPGSTDDPDDTQDDSGVDTSDTDTHHTGDTGDTDVPPPSCAATPNPSSLGPELCALEAPCSWQGDSLYEYFGYRVASGADLDGDGRQDMLIGSPNYDSGFDLGDEKDTGRVVLISGASLDQSGSDGVVSTLVGSGEYTGLGQDVIVVGDENGDGAADVLLGEWGYDTDNENAGAAWLVHGPLPAGSARVPSVAQTAFLGEAVSARVGTTVGPGGDLDGDGLADMVLSGELKRMREDEREERGDGVAYAFYGTDQAWAPTTSLAQADIRLEAEEDQDALGNDLSAAGDLDGDGYDDLVVGAPYASWPGAVYVLPGSADMGQIHGNISSAPVRILGEVSGDAFGWEVVVADLTGDGIDDLAVGAPLADDPWGSAGQVHLFAGAASFSESQEEVARIIGSWDGQQVGTGLAADDVDADGTADLLVGAVAAMQGLVTKGGRAVLFYGGSGWAAEASIDDAPVVVHGAGVKDFLGHAGALGDLDADGHADLLLPSAYVNVGDTTFDAGTVYLFWGE